MVSWYFHLDVELFPTTPINISRLENELSQHPDRSFVTFLFCGLRQGFHTGMQTVPVQTLHGENLRSTRNNISRCSVDFVS